MQVLDFSTANSQISDEVINVANSNPIGLDHDVFYNKIGKLVVIRTAAGGGGTLLVETTDYALGSAFPDGDFPTSISPDVGYQTVAITNATYHSTPLYVSYYPIMDIIEAEDHNDLDARLPNVGSFTVSEVISDTELLNTLVFDLSASGSITCTMPDATIRTNEEFTVFGSGGDITTNLLTMATVSSQTIGGLSASSWKIEGTGLLKVISNGTHWEVLSFTDYGGDVTSHDGGWKKNQDRTWVQSGVDLTTTSVGPYTITLPYPAADANYKVTQTTIEEAGATYAVPNAASKTSTDFTYRTDSAPVTGSKVNWAVEDTY